MCVCVCACACVCDNLTVTCHVTKGSPLIYTSRKSMRFVILISIYMGLPIAGH